MLVLFETPAGHALFSMTRDLPTEEDVTTLFADPASANSTLKLKAFNKFENTTDALSAVTGIVEGKLSKNLKGFLEKEIVDKKSSEKLVVADAKLGSSISKKLGIKVVADQSVNELMRGIRSQLEALLPGIQDSDMRAMVLGLSHSLSRYKLKFSPDKVDTMIIQAINLLDDLDKELNTYSMRVKEWYGWHFPEMTKIVVDNLAYAKVVKQIGFRSNAAQTDLSTVLPEEVETEVKHAAQISMGTEISDQDIENISFLCDQIISIANYRAELYDYLKSRMAAIAPNLTSMVGEIVGAKLIAHAGSLLNLAKYPASTVQILGAEKALFRALKTKHDTPKYGLIYHASLVGQATPKLKGKIARAVATKTALSIRCDALGETETPEIGIEQRAKVEARLRQLEGKSAHKANNGFVKSKPQMKKHEMKATPSYNTAADVTITAVPKAEEENVKVEDQEKKKKKKKSKESKKEEVVVQEPAASSTSSSKKRKAEDPVVESEKKKKKKKKD